MAQFSSLDAFDEVVKVISHTGLGCWACLILSECYSPDLTKTWSTAS